MQWKHDEILCFKGKHDDTMKWKLCKQVKLKVIKSYGIQKCYKCTDMHCKRDEPVF